MPIFSTIQRDGRYLAFMLAGCNSFARFNVHVPIWAIRRNSTCSRCFHLCPFHWTKKQWITLRHFETRDILIFATDRTRFHWISLHSSCCCRDWEHSGFARCQLGSISPLWRLQSPEKKRTQKAQDSPRNFLRHSRPASLHFFFAVGYECALNSFPSQRSWWLQVKDFSLRQWKDSRKSMCRRSYRKGSCKSHPFPLKIKIPIKGLQKKLGNDAAFIRMSHVNPCERFQCKANLS